ncbi:MAG: SDR family oxidoreductase [Spirochaetales bacterium]|nr:SDR family oxidoreductase [Leptospiraceae bacterium]MCP5483055.1 SDR family oxidoreductase [Spirochaetales bacterium]MCP5486137.1 SDR family oxidoreductase [Spirochaetales bacterium]
MSDVVKSEEPFIFKDGLLKGKVAFVTGGSSGIGLGVVHRLAQAGADIAIASRREEQCARVASEIARLYGVRAIGLGMDVRDSGVVNQTFRRVVDELGQLDILVNNAAGNFYFPAHKLRDKLWHAVIDIDLNGTFYCCRAAHRHMKDRGGHIVSISMTLHKDGWVGMAPACAAKSGIDALTKTLALEWARFGIRVNAVAPGPIVTEGVTKAFEKGGDFEKFVHTIPLRRGGKPEEIGDMIVFMSSPSGSWMTGSIVVMDGGESISPHRGSPDPEELDRMLAERKQSD